VKVRMKHITPCYRTLAILVSLLLLSGHAVEKGFAADISPTTFDKIFTVTKRIVYGIASIGLEKAGSGIMGSAWPYFKAGMGPVIDRLRDDYPDLFSSKKGSARAQAAAENAVYALETDERLRSLLVASFESLQEGQDEIIAQLAAISGQLESIDTRTMRLEEQGGEILRLLKKPSREEYGAGSSRRRSVPAQPRALPALNIRKCIERNLFLLSSAELSSQELLEQCFISGTIKDEDFRKAHRKMHYVEEEDNDTTLSQKTRLDMKTAYDIADYGYDLFEAQDYSATHIVFGSLLLMNARDDYFHTMYAASAAKMGINETAISHYTNALRLDTDNCTSRVNRGELYYSQNHSSIARNDLQKAASVCTDESKGSKLRAEVLLMALEADLSYKDALRIIEEEADLWYEDALRIIEEEADR